MDGFAVGLCALAMVGVARVLGREHARGRAPSVAMQAVLGVVMGLLGALAVLASRIDIVPDRFETWPVGLVVLVVAAAAVVGYRKVARRLQAAAEAECQREHPEVVVAQVQIPAGRGRSRLR